MNRINSVDARALTLTLLLTLIICSNSIGQGFKGYYRYPALSASTIVFGAEGDLWKVDVSGGIAQRLTTHAGEESYPSISPDGKTVAFSATYEGVGELYTMPIDGGLPTRWTFEASSSRASGWTPSGELLYTTTHYSTLPMLQMVRLNTKTKSKSIIPLAEASEGVYDETGKSLYFVRPGYHNNVTKRYKGGTARMIWKFSEGDDEATKISDGYTGESHHPMWWNGRIYFITDRDGIMNIWSTTELGKDYQQHTNHSIFDIRYSTQNNGKIIYQIGADIRIYDIESNTDTLVPITLASDLDQRREKWVTDPQNYITSIKLHPEGDKIAITARGRVFVAPAKAGRLVQLSRKEGVRYRDANFAANGEDVLVLTDESGEFEFSSISANGVGNHTPLTNDGKILRYGGSSSPDGEWICYSDLNSDLWLLNLETKKQIKVSSNREGIGQFSWSPDSKWIAFSQSSTNTFTQIHLYNVDNGKIFPLTTDRANSSSPVWSPDGKFIYLLSDRNFQSLVGSPWGTRQPEPFFDRKMKVYQIGLQNGSISPFQPDNELLKLESSSKSTGTEITTIETEGIMQRIQEVPIRPGNYRSLAVNDKALFFLESGTGIGSETVLKALKVDNKGDEAVTMVSGVRNFELSTNGKKLGLTKGRDYFVIGANPSPVSKVNSSKVNLSGWAFSMDPVEDWKQLFTDAWRMERDYFYDANMHGVDWTAMYERYLPLVDRITTRLELSDLIGRFVGELSALHTSVRGGDIRTGSERVSVPSLGARFTRSEKSGGYVVDYIYKTDPDYPNEISPLLRQGVNMKKGDVITHINGDPSLGTQDIGELLRNQTNKQVRISVKTSKGNNQRDLIVRPIGNERSLRYRDWEYSRRLAVEEKSDKQLGYVHLQAMGSGDISQWYREFYPVFNRKGLIIDVRNNRGGNIESFILEKLLRKAWFYWKGRVGEPYGNMPYSFNGHMVVLVNAATSTLR